VTHADDALPLLFDVRPSELSPEIGDGENREGGSHDARNSAAIQLKVSAEDFATLAPTVVAQDYSRFE
jgi:hypothetical protein